MNCPKCNESMTEGKKMWYCKNDQCDIIQRRKRSFDPLTLEEVRQLWLKERRTSRKLRKQLRSFGYEPII